ncbi:DUF502 domain-containing protein [Wenxinia saemankumensis]|uniref:Uncharacterized membrane protein n=1 Tax=Wenxinia saemankumensis TaxID=1447782 RepID=A0A1M6A639_9RHOB|nr:DUF502 domain-containing protein [Wenxinia saemankumensis]SHI31916.1 Uncharacterized membrane protein [Wenxinia saemankumensis]
MTRPDLTEPLPPPPPPRRRGLFGGLRNNFLAGVVVIAPIGLTVWLIWTVVGWVDGFVMPFVPRQWHPEQLVNSILGRGPDDWITVNIRGVGVVVFLIFTVIIGWLAKGFFGRSLLRTGESLVGRMPVVRSIYSGAKQIAETVFAQQESSFDNACLVEYPRRGVWAVAFISTSAKGEVRRRVDAEDLLTVFLPTTPNPTSGFLLFVPRSEVIVLDMTVEDAAKLVISAGLVYPADREAPAPGAQALPVADRGRARAS